MSIPSEEKTREMLKKEKTYNIRIKPEKNNPNYVTEVVYVNGVAYQIEVGADAQVPETVYKLLQKKGVI